MKRYELINHVICQGTYGTITPAYDRSLYDECVLKIVQGSEREKELARNEIFVMRSLKHPNIMRVRDAFED